MNEGAMRRLKELLPDLKYDTCVITGDRTFGPFDDAFEGMKRLRSLLGETAYGVLGNHNTIRMVPGLEDMGIRVLLNERERLSRRGESIYLAGIDDAHYYRVDNIEKAASNIPPDAFFYFAVPHPEVYRHAAHGFDLLLSGHTHGRQICLPGSLPITLSSVLPRGFGSGVWRYHDMVGYTSVGAGSSTLRCALIALQKSHFIISKFLSSAFSRCPTFSRSFDYSD
jgi:predicted MPP superfamily phosphohydrolase